MNAPRRTLGEFSLVAASLAVAVSVGWSTSSVAQSTSGGAGNGGWQATTRSDQRAPAAKSTSKKRDSRKVTKARKSSGTKSRSSSGATAAGKNGGKLDAAAAQQAIESGIRALNAGKHTAAVSDITAALDAGTLPSSQTARALYYRGLAYRGSTKPARAIADLTSALWLKKGLDPQQRKDALAQRSAAYREAGLPDQSNTETAQRRSSAASKATNETPARTPSSTASTGLGGLFGGLFGGGSTAASKTNTPESVATSRPATAAWTASSTGSLPVPPKAVPSPVPPAAASRSWNAGTTVKIERPSPAAASASGNARSGAPSPAIAQRAKDNWNSATAAPARTAVRTAARTSSDRLAPSKKSTSKPVKKAAVSRAAKRPRAAVSGVGSGRFGIQVAAVRNPKDAQAVVSRVQQRMAQHLGGRAAVVEQAVVNNMGTIYRVRIGPFSTLDESKAMCGHIKSDGMACIVVRQ